MTADADQYAEMLGEYFSSRGEAALYRASLLSRRFIEAGLGPEEIVALHAEAVERATKAMSYRERARASTDALQFLLEVMIAYGVQYSAFLDLRQREREREMESLLFLERQRSDDAERSQRENDEILGTISHELRTPLAAGLGNVDLALRHLDRGQIERLPRVLQSARDALARLARLADELVEASRGARPPVTLQPTDGAAILEQACSWVRPQADGKGVALVYGDRCDGCPVLADADALLTIFTNLLSNAVRYTPAGGRIEARCGADAAEVWFSVSDTGIGMSEEVRARIFERFYRSPEAKRSEPRGLGLGLSITAGLTEAQGGALDVASAPGAGSTFTIRLARSRPVAEEETERAIP